MPLAMMGRNHLIAGTALASTLMAGLSWASRSSSSVLPDVAVLVPWSDIVRELAQDVLGRFAPDGGAALLLVPLMAGLFWLGCLFSDIDNERSMLGRRLHVPLRHRGWTHTDWILVPLVVLAVLDPSGLVAWFALGLWTHLALDELSVAGRVHFYPLTSYKVYTARDGNEIVVKRCWVGLYAVGSIFEMLLVVLLVGVALISSWLVWVA